MEYLITVGILGLGYVYSNNGKKKNLSRVRKFGNLDIIH